jgi:hypothetical protein
MHGIADGIVRAGEATTTIDVALGGVHWFRSTLNLSGSDGFLYYVDCTGTLQLGGGTSEGGVGRAYDWGGHQATINGEAPCVVYGRLEEQGRQVVLGPRPAGGLIRRRKIFVPAEGDFARFLEILTNTSTAPRTVQVSVQSGLSSGDATRIVVSPSATSNTFAVTDNAEGCCNPALAQVFGGPGAPLAADTAQFAAGQGDVSYGWTVTVGPGETVVLMHFAVQRAETDAAGARVQAEALASLSDPRALTGMTAAETGRVVNFRIP